VNSEQPGTAVVLQPAHPCPFDEPTVGSANVGDVRAQQKVLANSTAGIQVLSTSVNNTTATAAISEYSQKTHISKYQFIIKISTIPNIVLIHHNICVYIYTYSYIQEPWCLNNENGNTIANNSSEVVQKTPEKIANVPRKKLEKDRYKT
jgi:hypothetical protein